jgi:hypothetical protein
MTRAVLLAAIVLTHPVAFHSTCVARDDAKSKDLNQASMEIDALKILNALDLTAAQSFSLAGLGDGAADSRKREAAKASAKYRTALVALHAAQSKNDEEKIADAQGELEELAEEPDRELDDGIEITEEARKRAGKALTLLKPRQIAAFTALISVTDPVEVLVDGLEDARAATEKEESRKNLANEVVEYVPAEDVERVRKSVLDFVKKIQDMSDDDFKKKQDGLEGTAGRAIGNVDPVSVLRRNLERAMAELLSNPGLDNAIKVVQSRPPEES